jgi:predicted SprT family Zn-dependent metalloprotease
MSITTIEYICFQQAYDFFNATLFEGQLPEVLITLQRQANTRGYFSAQQFNGRIKESVAHELAMNPDTFGDRTDEEIISTLVHEMCHIWQHCFGQPGRGRYHNRQWATKIKELGLQPSDTGEPGGKETGQRVSHYIIADGPYAQAYQQLTQTGFKLNWNSRTNSQAQKLSKAKFSCPTCGQNAWAKPDAELVCGYCQEPMASTVSERKLGQLPQAAKAAGQMGKGGTGSNQYKRANVGTEQNHQTLPP